MKHEIQLPKYEAMPVILNSGQIVDWGHDYLRAQEFYETSRGEDAVIFVLDTAGTFSDHPDLKENAIPELDRVYTSEAATDGHGHGTHCAGIAAASDNSVGVIGIAPAAGLVAYKVLTNTGSGSFAWVAAAIRDIADLPYTGPMAGRKKIISMSLGGPAGMATPSALDEAIRYAAGKGVFIVAAAGNSGFDGNQSTVGAPGNHPLVISVAATSKPGNVRASYSSGGEEVDLTAPGTSVYSTHKGGGYARLSGTSMACPQVAGVLALILSAHPEITSQQQALAFLTANATDILTTGRDDESGWGSPVLTGYIGEVPSDDPIEDEPEEPIEDEPIEDPKLPMRAEVGTGRYLAANFPLSLFWRANDETGLRVGIFTDITVSVTSKVRAEVVGEAVKAYAKMFFSNRGIVLPDNNDVLDLAVWTAAFMQFISDDDNVIEAVGFALDLKVLSITATDTEGNQATVEQVEIAARADQLRYDTNAKMIAQTVCLNE